MVVLIAACCACSGSIRHQRTMASTQQVSVAEDGELSITLTGYDVDGTAAPYEVITHPSHGTLSGGGATWTYQPAADYFGDDLLRFAAVNDDMATSADVTFNITVIPVNDPPVAYAGGDQLVRPDSTVAVLGNATDVDHDGADLDFAWSQLSASPENAPALELTPADAAVLAFTAPRVAAVYALQLRVSDPSGAHSTDTVRITIDASDRTNQTPVAHSRQVAVTEDGDLSITLAGSDADGTLTAYVVTTNPAHGTLSGSGAAWRYRPTPNYFGDDLLRFAVVDDDGAVSAVAAINITVIPVNDPPAAYAGDDRVASTDSTVTVAGIGTDVDDEETDLSFAWSQLSAAPEDAPALVLTPADAAVLTFAAPSVAAVYTLQLRVSDPSGAHSTDTVRITIKATEPSNEAPVAHPQQVSVAEDRDLSITLAGHDPDGTVTAYVVTTHPEHGTLSGTGAARTYRPTADYFGDDLLRFKVADDDRAESAIATINITVTPVNDPPVADAGRDQVVSTGSTVTVTGSGTDVDSDDASLSHAWSQLSAAPANAPALALTADGARLTVTAPDRETVTAYTLRLVVTDDAHAAASDTVRITVSDRTAPLRNLVVRGVTGSVNVSMWDGIGFGPGQHGARITATFEAHTTQASLTQIEGENTNTNGYTNHVLRHNDGIFWTATDTSPSYQPGKPGWFIEDGRPFRERARDFADWMEHQNVLLVSSLENPTHSGGQFLYCDDVQDASDFRPLCGELDDYIANTGTGLNNTIMVGSLGITSGGQVFASAAIRAGGVFADAAVWAPVRITSESTSNSSSHSAAVVAAIATNIAAELATQHGRVPTAAEIKAELLRQAAMKKVHDGTSKNCLRVIGLVDSLLSSLSSCTE